MLGHRYAIPQIVSPCFGDQDMWAERVDHLGVGVSLGALADLDAASLDRAFTSCVEDKSGAVAEALKSYSGRHFVRGVNVRRQRGDWGM
jgi:UDP:flavonoid glycosyltransferase YjiC (YdhE family)